MHQLPHRIAAVMIGTIAVLVLTLGVSITWLTRALDRQAAEHSLQQVESARANLLEHISLLNLDYAKWDAALPALAGPDMTWIWENVGLSAHSGEAFQLAVLWGGGLPSDVGWMIQGPEAPQHGLLDPATMSMVEARLDDVPMNTYDGVEFFAWRDEDLWVLAGARVEVGDDTVDPSIRDEDVGRMLLGHRLDAKAVVAVEADYVLQHLEVSRLAPAERSSIPLLGGDGQPVAYLSWETPRPGSKILGRLLAPLLFVIALTVGLSALGMRLVQGNARHLVEAEFKASQAARTDVMTGLPNRAAYNELLAQPSRAGSRAILFLDVNGFKRINDSIGHAAGDGVVVEVARRLASLVGRNCILARIAGDEFVFIITGDGAQDRAVALAAEVDRLLEAPFHMLGHQLTIRVAKGYAVQGDDNMTGDDLVRQADLAMYEAKRHPERGLVGYSSLIEQASRDALKIEHGLRAAMSRPGELSIAYQPIAGRDGRMVRAEALARWTSQELGVVPPNRFIAVAEQGGLIVELGWHLFRLVCDDLATHPDLRISLNISPLQLMAPDFVPTLMRELRYRGIDPARIEIELTESVVVDDSRLATRRLREIQAAGFSTALDDFGTGYSSIGYLRQLGFDTLKVDRSFVSEIQTSSQGSLIVSGMITMAHGMGLCVVCEGVETAEELRLLRELGCDLAQGYYLDRPMPIGALASRWLSPDSCAAVA